MVNPRAGRPVEDAPDPHPLRGGPRGAILRWSLRALSLVALLVSGFLAWISLTQDVALAGCGGVAFFDCDAVLGSRWATWFGLPVSVPAVAVYGAMLAATILIGPRFSPALRTWAWHALIPLAVAAAGAALWFTGLLIFQNEALCPYCLAVHACGLAMAGLVLAGGPIGRSHAEQQWLDALGTAAGARQAPPHVAVSPMTAAELGLAGLVGVVVLVMGQWLTTPPPTHRIEEPAEVAVEGPDGSFSFPDVSGVLREPQQDPREPRSTQDPSSLPPEGPGNRAPDDSGPREVSLSNGGTSAQDGDEPTGDGNPVEGPPHAAGQPHSPPPSEGLPPHQEVRFLNNKVPLNTSLYPVLGHPGAEHVVVDMFDYTCKHCRKMHHQLNEARRRYGIRLAVVIAPVPMKTHCNAFVTSDHPDHLFACHYAKLALAVWRLEPEKFEEFHEWLLGPDVLPPWQGSVDHAAELVGGKDVLAPEFTGEEVQRMVRRNTLLYRWSGMGRIPKLLIGSAVLVGETRDAEELCGILENRLGIRPLEP